MPNPDEVAELSVNGKLYSNWTTVSVARAFGKEASETTFSVASDDEAVSWARQTLKIGDRCTAKLAGQKVADGLIYLRQVAYDSRAHALQVQVISKTIDLTYGTVNSAPGQFKNYTLQQIGAALAKPFGVQFKVEGNPKGADKPFPRFNVQPGETVTNAILRLCRMRNLFLVDDNEGNLIAKRIDGNGPIVAHLEEGRNILSASCVASDENVWSKIEVQGQRPGNDQSWGDDARDVAASVTNGEVKRHRPYVLQAEEPGDKADMQMRAEYQSAVSVATMIQAEVTVQGWHDPAGDLWINSVGKMVVVKSPMLFPNEKMALAVQGVVHRQTNAGTTTAISLIIPHKLGQGGQIQADGPDYTKANAAKPEPADV